MMYELFYSSGGHGGPYHGISQAFTGASRYLDSEVYVDIVPYSKDGYDKTNGYRVRKSTFQHVWTLAVSDRCVEFVNGQGE